MESEFELEHRTCSNGCGTQFKTLKTSKQNICSVRCRKSKKGNKLAIPDYLKYGERPSGSLLSKGKSDLFKTKRPIKISVEGDYVSVSGSNDGFLYLEGMSLLPVIKKMLKSPTFSISTSELEELVCSREGASHNTVSRWVVRARGLLQRNFGGEWFIFDNHTWYLVPKDVAIIPSVKELFIEGSDKKVSFKKEGFSENRIKMNPLSRTQGKRVVLDQEQIQLIRNMFFKGKSSYKISDAIGVSRTWVDKYLRDVGLITEEGLPLVLDAWARKAVIDLSNQNRSDIYIANVIGKSRNFVDAYKKLHGIEAKTVPELEVKMTRSAIYLDGSLAPITRKDPLYKVLYAILNSEDFTIRVSDVYRAIYGKHMKTSSSVLHAHRKMDMLKAELLDFIPFYKWLPKVAGKQNVKGESDAWRLVVGEIKLTREGDPFELERSDKRRRISNKVVEKPANGAIESSGFIL